jgi:hypothetical protein
VKSSHGPSKSNRYRFARFGAKDLPIAVPQICRNFSLLNPKSLLHIIVSDNFIIPRPVS